MDRRVFLVRAATWLAAPLAAEAQVVPRIGLLDSGSRVGRALQWAAFHQGMRDLGYIEGRTVTFETRTAEGKYERLPALAAELARLKVDVIVTSGTATLAARQATATIPIVSASINPPGPPLIASLARPGGNVTGLTSLSGDLRNKRLELARELVPGASRLALLWNMESAGADAANRETEASARTLGVHLHVVGIRDPIELDRGFTAIVREHPAALMVNPSVMFFGERWRLAELAMKHRLPTVFGMREYVEAGGLIAYGSDVTERYRRAALYVDKILKGAKPGDLPVEQPSKFELVINLKTAKALGFTIPPSVLARADEVIQ